MYQKHQKALFSRNIGCVLSLAENRWQYNSKFIAQSPSLIISVFNILLFSICLLLYHLGLFLTPYFFIPSMVLQPMVEENSIRNSFKLACNNYTIYSWHFISLSHSGFAACGQSKLDTWQFQASLWSNYRPNDSIKCQQIFEIRDGLFTNVNVSFKIWLFG